MSAPPKTPSKATRARYGQAKGNNGSIAEKYTSASTPEYRQQHSESEKHVREYESYHKQSLVPPPQTMSTIPRHEDSATSLANAPRHFNTSESRRRKSSAQGSESVAYRQPSIANTLDGTRGTDNLTSAARASENTTAKFTATPVKQAYAGPTFHASPAASSLPMPRLFSKPVSSLNTGNNSAEPDAPLASSYASQSTPSRPGAHGNEATPERNESPLDILFNAQRAERARSSVSTPAGRSNSSNPDSSYDGSRTTSVGVTSVAAHGNSLHKSLSGKASMIQELDRIPDESESDEDMRTVTFKERVHSLAIPPNSSNSTRGDLSEEERHAKTRALKQLVMAPTAKDPLGERDLQRNANRSWNNEMISDTPIETSSWQAGVGFNTGNPIETRHPRSYTNRRVNSVTATNDVPGGSSTVGHHNNSTSFSTERMDVNTHQSNPKLKTMEDSLRKMLNLRETSN